MKPNEPKKGTSAAVILGVAAAAGLTVALLASREAEAAPGTATLEGYVRDASTNQPVTGAKIDLIGGLSMISSSTGYFKFTALLPGDYTLVCSRDGYDTLTNVISLIEGVNQYEIPLVPSSGGPTTSLEYASAIEWTEPGSHSGMATVSIFVKIKNTGSAPATAHPTGEVKTYLENNGDPYPRFLPIDMGTQTIQPGQTVTFTDTISEYPDEHIILVTIQSEAGVISSEFEDVAELLSLAMPASLVSEQEYWAQVVLRLPYKANRCYRVDMYLSGNYGLDFSAITSPAIKASLMPQGTKESLVSYYLQGAGDYTVKGVWISDGTKQVQYKASATYQFTQEGTGMTITKALPAGIYNLKLKVTWYEFYIPNVYGQSGTLLSIDLGNITVLAAPGLPTGIYNMSGPASAEYGQPVNVTANIRNGGPAPKNFRVGWMTSVDFVPYSESNLNIPANSEKQSSYSFSMPPIMWTWGSSIRVWCSLYDGETLLARQELYIGTTPQPNGTFVCPACGWIGYSEEAYIQHMMTH